MSAFAKNKLFNTELFQYNESCIKIDVGFLVQGWIKSTFYQLSYFCHNGFYLFLQTNSLSRAILWKWYNVTRMAAQH